MDFFAATVRNPNTHEAYYRAVCRFMDWCERRGLLDLGDVLPIHVAAYIEQLPFSRASVKQHLSAISRCFDWLVSGGTLESNPATYASDGMSPRSAKEWKLLRILSRQEYKLNSVINSYLVSLAGLQLIHTKGHCCLHVVNAY